MRLGADGGEGTDAELLDQDDDVAVWIVEDDSNRVTPLENLAPDRAALPAGEQAMAKRIAIDSEEPRKHGLQAFDLDVVSAHRRPDNRALTWF